MDGGETVVVVRGGLVSMYLCHSGLFFVDLKVKSCVGVTAVFTLNSSEEKTLQSR